MRAYSAKEKLKITPAQEAAWTSFTAGTQMQAHKGPRPTRGDFEKLTTPQRIDKMREMRTQHHDHGSGLREVVNHLVTDADLQTDYSDVMFFEICSTRSVA
jgi:hypothetical protein